jgi:glycosyltransferase involved in cell wall biosynthesis
MRRVLVIHNSLVLGGAELSLCDFIEAAVLERRFQFFVACPSGAAVGARLERLGVPTLPITPLAPRRPRGLLSALRLLLLILRINWQVRQWIRRKRIALVHANNTFACLQGLLAAKLAGVPIVWHVRDAVRLPSPGHLLQTSVDHTITVSDAVRRAVFDRRARRVSTIYNGVRVDPGASAFGEDLAGADPGGAPGADIITVAQFVPWKRHLVTLQVAAQLKARLGRIRVVLVGPEHDRAARAYAGALRRTAEAMGLADSVVFAGERADVHRLIARSRLLLHPSLGEPMGRVVVEAFFLGTPVVAADSGGVAELIEPGVTGILVPPDDLEGFVSATEAILSRGRPAQMIHTAYRRACERFAPPCQSQKVLAIYEGLRPRAPPRLPRPTRPRVPRGVDPILRALARQR